MNDKNPCETSPGNVVSSTIGRVDRPSKKEIKEAVERLKNKPVSDPNAPKPIAGKLTDKKTSQRIRKQGV